MGRTRLRYAPSPGQLAFHHDRYVYDERLLSCGSGGGKSYCMLFEVVDWCLENPPGTVLYAMPNVPMIKKTVYPAWTELTGAPLGARDSLGEDWNSTDRHLRLPNGWDIWFVTVEDPTSIEGPPSVDLAVLDEARVVRRLAGEDGAWAQLTRRLRGSADVERRRGAIMGTHSPSKQIVELFKPRSVTRWKAPGPAGARGYYEVADCEEPTRRAYQWSLQDAVAWRTLDEAGAKNILRGLTTEAAKKRVAEGRYALASGRVFDQYDEARHLRAAPKMRGGYRVSGGVDWGWDVCALVVSIDTGSRRHTAWEARLEAATLQDIAAEMRSAHAKYGQFRWWGGPDRPDSCKELRDLRLDVQPAKPSKVEDGVALMQKDLAQDEWSIDPTCQNLREDLEQQIRDETTGEIAKNAYDAHFADAARYDRVMAGRSTGFAVG